MTSMNVRRMFPSEMSIHDLPNPVIDIGQDESAEESEDQKNTD